MDPLQLETNLIPCVPASDDLFKPGIFDGRFLASDFVKFQTSTSISNNPIEILFPALRSNACYRVKYSNYLFCLSFLMLLLADQYIANVPSIKASEGRWKWYRSKL